MNFHELSKLPPVINLIEVLLRNNFKITLITLDETNKSLLNEFKDKKVNIIYLKSNSKIHLIDFFIRKIKLRKIVENLMKENDYIWTTTDRTVREVGKSLFKYKHIMQLMELLYDIPYFPKQNLIKTNLKKYAKKAYKVVVPEYNRAHIQKTWWNLDEIPVVLPNKPAIIDYNTIVKDEKISSLINNIKSKQKKIIIYQGVIRKERPLEPIAAAVDTIKNDYIFLIMGQDSEGEVNRLKSKYDCIVHIPFVAPPDHLKITRLAHIGILSYIPEFNSKLHFSELNALFCAPNKIYEYAAYHLPMLGNDVPGLKIPFDLYNIGLTCNFNDIENIKNSILSIEKNYEKYSDSCIKFFDNTNLDHIILNEILGDNKN